jgi:hypothetical protein
MSVKKHAEWQAVECERLQRALAKAEQERDVAVADNAVLVGEVERLCSLLEWLRSNDSMSDDGRARSHKAEKRAKRSCSDHPGTALLEQRRRELARARNEGFERAVEFLRERAATMTGFTARSPSKVAASLAADVAALKEPEECGSPRLSDDYVRGVRAAIQVAKEEGSAEIAGCIADLLEPEE